jgi:RNA polymerase sigma factor (sigma-70 family)
MLFKVGACRKTRAVPERIARAGSDAVPERDRSPEPGTLVPTHSSRRQRWVDACDGAARPNVRRCPRSSYLHGVKRFQRCAQPFGGSLRGRDVAVDQCVEGEVGAGVSDDSGLTDRDRLEFLFLSQYDALVRVARLLGAGDDAEDVVQNAFYRLSARGALRDPNLATAYLRRTIVNSLRSRWRHAASAARFSWLHRSDDINEADIAMSVTVRAALAGLPRRQREAVVLRFFLDLSEAGTADAMSVSVGSVKAYTSRGLATLRELLNRRDL